MAELDPRNGEKTNATHVWLILWRAFHAIEQNALRSIAATGLGLSDFAVLEALLHKGPQPVNVLGRRILLTSGSITTAVRPAGSEALGKENRRFGRPTVADCTTHRRRPANYRELLQAARRGHGKKPVGAELRRAPGIGPFAPQIRPVGPVAVGRAEASTGAELTAPSLPA